MSSPSPRNRRSGKRQSRQLWLTVHLWLGLSAGLLFALIGLTGSALVFYPEIDEWLNSHIVVADDCQPQSLDVIYQSLLAAHPERSSGWRLEMPSAQQSALTARYMKPAETAGETFAPLLVSINPCTLEQTPRFWGQTLMTWIYQLHFELLVDLPGRLIVAVVGVLALISTLSGLYLWWPSHWRKWPQALRWRPSGHPVRNNLQLHNLAALYSLPVVLGLIVTGVILAQPGWFQPATNALLPSRAAPDLTAALEQTSPSPETETPSQPPVSLKQLLTITHQTLPGGDIRWLYLPADPAGVAMVRVYMDQFSQGEASYRFANNKLWIDRRSGEVIAQRSIADARAGDLFWQWLHPLHNGEVFGLLGRILVFISGLVPALLCWTGWVRWRQKRRARLQ